jgi:hypothetical protein
MRGSRAFATGALHTASGGTTRVEERSAARLLLRAVRCEGLRCYGHRREGTRVSAMEEATCAVRDVSTAQAIAIRGLLILPERPISLHATARRQQCPTKPGGLIV